MSGSAYTRLLGRGLLALWLAQTAFAAMAQAPDAAADIDPAAIAGAAADGGGAAGTNGDDAAAVAPDPLADEPGVTLRELLDLPQLRHEADIAAFLEQSVASEVQAGVSRDLSQRTRRFVRREDVILAALRKNLALRSTEANIGVFEQALLEAEAVFDPVFDLSLSYRRTNTHKRTEVGLVSVRQFTPQTPLDIPVSPFNPLPQIDQLGFLQQQGVVEEREIEASKSRPGGPDEPIEYSVGVSQQLPWGPQVSLFTGLVDRRVYRNSRGESFKADWTAQLALDVVIPLPYTRNFGPLAPANFAVDQAALIDERTEWDVRIALNSIMAGTDVAYWQLVGALENLRIATENRKLIQQQFERAVKLFDARVMTEYGKAVIETERARALVLEEAAKNEVIAAANALAPLIEESGGDVRDNLYIPADYLEGLDARAEIDLAGAVRHGLENRPELRQAEVDLRTRDLERRFAAVQTRPDIQVDGRVAGQQKSDPYGYQHPTKALGRIFDPDSSQMSSSISLLRPWGNVPARAQLRQAELGQDDQGLAVRNLEYDVTREVNDALDRLYGARMRIGFADQNLKLAEAAYERLLTRREIGADVAALEIVTAIQAMLTAKGDRIAALIDNKVAETQLLAAQGTVASEFTSTEANGPLENRRLDALRASNALRYFAPAAAAPNQP